MKYQHLFFDLDHTLWDFEANSRETLMEIFDLLELEKYGVNDFDRFHKNYLLHNDKLWDRYRNGHIRVDVLRWKRMWLSLMDFKIGDEKLAKEMGKAFLDILPNKTLLFPYAKEILQYLTDKKYSIHMITNGFENTQRSKLIHSGIDKFFNQVITSESSNSLKPHPEIFEYALMKTGAIKEESIMIGDTPDVDIRGAIGFGMDQVFVNHVNHHEKVQATYTVSSLKELESIF